MSLDSEGKVIVSNSVEASAPGIFAAGDIRRDSPGQIVAATGDGAYAALSAIKFLDKNYET